MKLDRCLQARPRVVPILLVASVVLAGCSFASASQNPPVIDELTAELSVVLPSQQCNLTCAASDADGDTLLYEWSANRGTISPTGSEAVWVAPDEMGKYTITAAVSDGNGGRCTRYLTIEVCSNHPPVIESLEMDATEVEVSTSWKVVCAASDEDGHDLSYEWSADGGSFSGEGSTVTWTGPDGDGAYTITVKVSDTQGGEATESVEIDVLLVNEPPDIDDFVVTGISGNERDNLKVLKEHYYYIECVASDPDGDDLKYKWWASDGTILKYDDAILSDTPESYVEKIEDGAMILWHAPDCSLSTVTIEATVTDKRGDREDDAIRLKVVVTKCQLFS